MQELWATVGLVAAVFVATNVDDIFILVALFANPRFRTGQIVAGQLLGMLVIVGLSLAAAWLALRLAPGLVGLLGFVPLALGLYELVERVRGTSEDDDSAVSMGAGGVLAVTLITVANGGDNVALYVPLFAAQGVGAAALSAGSFLALTLGLCWLARSLVVHPRLGAPLRKYGAALAPFVLIGLGLLILIDSGALRLLF